MVNHWPAGHGVTRQQFSVHSFNSDKTLLDNIKKKICISLTVFKIPQMCIAIKLFRMQEMFIFPLTIFEMLNLCILLYFSSNAFIWLGLLLFILYFYSYHIKLTISLVPLLFLITITAHMLSTKFINSF